MPKDEWRRANNRARFGPSNPKKVSDFTKCPKGFKCPECGGKMIVRVNKKTGNLFAGCKKFPDCRGTLPYESGRN